MLAAVIFACVTLAGVLVLCVTWREDIRHRRAARRAAAARDSREDGPGSLAWGDPARERIAAPLPRRIPPGRCGDCGRKPCTRHDVAIRDLLDRYDKEIGR